MNPSSGRTLFVAIVLVFLTAGGMLMRSHLRTHGGGNEPPVLLPLQDVEAGQAPSAPADTGESTPPPGVEQASEVNPESGDPAPSRANRAMPAAGSQEAVARQDENTAQANGPAETAAKGPVGDDPQRQAADLLSRPVDLSDPKKRAEMVAKLRALENREAEATREKAARLGIPLVIVDKNGRKLFLVGFDGDQPRYEADMNINAAISTGAKMVRDVAPFQANGLGLVFGLWEYGGVPRTTHQEFNSPSKITVRDGAIAVSDHASHVAGTLAALGIDPSALGMAPSATIDAYEATNDLSEMLAAGAVVAGESGKIYVSNHSYGLIRGWDDVVWYGSFTDNGNPSDDVDTRCGRYDSSTATVDGVLFNLPYYLSFWHPEMIAATRPRPRAPPGMWREIPLPGPTIRPSIPRPMVPTKPVTICWT